MAEPIELLAKNLGIKLNTRGSTLLVRRDDCAAIVDACVRRNILILGVEGFRIEGAYLRVLGDLIADFSRVLNNKTPWAETCQAAGKSAQSYLALPEAKSADIWFEFVLEDQPNDCHAGP
ncbi:MAG: hypothetical protein IT462_16140 [Planctomycetes bacterium]|nr:hypothetical protein [Planctomycetota bacterium]